MQPNTITLTGPAAMPTSGNKPKQIVILLHGLGADGNDLFGLVQYFQEVLPEAYFISPDAPFACDMAPFGKQWFSLQDRSEAALVKEVKASAVVINQFIDQLLEKFELNDNQVALIGFSQGSMLSLYTALRRPKALMGVLAYSGALLAPNSLATELVSKLPICLLHGKQDNIVPFEAFEEALAALQKYKVEVHGYSSEHLGHGIDPSGVEIGTRFLKEISSKNPISVAV
jgi:phospholipase/carboxylesterase